MRSIIVAITALLIGVHALSAQEEVLRRTITHNGVEREYFVRLPADFDASRQYWLVVAAHDGGGNGETLFLARGIRERADELGLEAIVVSPIFSRTDVRSVAFPVLGEGYFLEMVLEDVRRQYDVRPKILLTGYSLGGQLLHRFALGWPNLVFCGRAAGCGCVDDATGAPPRRCSRNDR